jgi:hypothetical protein
MVQSTAAVGTGELIGIVGDGDLSGVRSRDNARSSTKSSSSSNGDSPANSPELPSHLSDRYKEVLTKAGARRTGNVITFDNPNRLVARGQQAADKSGKCMEKMGQGIWWKPTANLDNLTSLMTGFSKRKRGMRNTQTFERSRLLARTR